MTKNLENLQERLAFVRITVADLRQDLQAIALGLATDFTKAETERYLRSYSQKLDDLKAAIQAA
jgi:hypothetical protein